MGTCGDPNDETRIFTQRHRLWQEAIDAELERDRVRHKWRVRFLVAFIVLVPLSLAIWLISTVR